MGEESVKANIAGRFFGQSSFASRTIARESSVVNVKGLVNSDEELQLLAPLGCGIQTGSGTIAKVAEAGEGDCVAILGMGGVGLSGVMVGFFSTRLLVLSVMVWRVWLIVDGGADRWRRLRRSVTAELLSASIRSPHGCSWLRSSARRTSSIRRAWGHWQSLLRLLEQLRMVLGVRLRWIRQASCR